MEERPTTAGVVADDDEALVSGWEPSLAPSDTLTRACLENLSHEFLHPARTMGGRWEVDDDVFLGDIGSPCPFLNGAVLRRPLRFERPDPVLDRIEAFFAPSPGPAMVVSATPTPDLRTRGWQRVGHPPLMVRPPGGEAPPPPAGFRFEPVSDSALLETCCRIMVDGYPVPELQPYVEGAMFDDRVLGDPSFHLYVGYFEDQPVSSAMAVVDEATTGVHFVANAPSARGRGVGEATVWAATLADPTKPASLLASDLGRPTYERMGYLTISRWTVWVLPPGGS